MRTHNQEDDVIRYRADEKVFVEPRDEAEVGLQEHSIHDPHDVASAAVEGGHDEWHIGG